MWMQDIAALPDREKRLEAVLVDCYDAYEELGGLHAYLSQVLASPFAATWRDPGRTDHSESVTVLGVDDTDDRLAVLLKVKRRGGRRRRVPADQIWPDEPGVNAMALDDYRDWFGEGGALPEDDEYF